MLPVCRRARQIVATVLLVAFVQSPAVVAADRKDVALSGLDFGISVGKLLWVAVPSQEDVTRAEADQYTRLGQAVRDRIESGRASAGVIKGSFDFSGTTLAYAAAIDPEPLSKGLAGLGAWGAKKAGDAISGEVLDQSQKEAQAILAQGLKNSGLSSAELQAITPEQLRDRVADLQLGGEKLREILHDDPDSLNRLQAHAVDIATNIGVEALAQAKGTAADVATIRAQLKQTNDNLTAFQKAVREHLGTVEQRVSDLADATHLAHEKLDALKDAVQGNAAAIQTLAQISYAGWTTTQKLQAVQGGLFPNLQGKSKDALIASLQAEQNRELIVAGVSHAARDLGNLTAIASNLGLPQSTVQGLQTAQVVATGIAQFASGNYLGAVASVTSLVGLGAPDAAAQRHAAMMQYLQQQFAAINQKLDTVINLQVQTLKALDELAREQQSFRAAVLGQLDRVEDTVLRTERLGQAILLNNFTECHALINGSALNGTFLIPNRSILIELVANQNVPGFAGKCYAAMAAFFDAFVKPAAWSGQVIAADNFPTDKIANDSTLQMSWNAFQKQRGQAFSTARAFVFDALPDAPAAPARFLAHLTQPVVEARFAKQLDDALAATAARQRLDGFRCSDTDVLSPGLRDLICFGTVLGSPAPPQASRWRDLLDAALIGPYANRLIDTGLVLGTLSDFAQRTGAQTFVFAKPEMLANFADNGPTPEMTAALGEHKGIDLLTKLQWLSEAMVLQQAIMYGHHTAELAEKALYDPATHALTTDPQKVTPLQRLALQAMRANPVLARNVVMLAMRHAVSDALGGDTQADALRYRQTFYHLALRDFTGPQACSENALARAKLQELFPNWQFEYRVSDAQKQADSSLKDCPAEIAADLQNNALLPELGAGVAVSVGDFYALAPTPLVLSDGIFEQSDSLRLALAYRDRVSQAIIDRTFAQSVRQLAGNGADAKDIASRTAFAILNEGWDWPHRKSAQ